MLSSPTGQYETAQALNKHLSQPALLLIASIFASTSCPAINPWHSITIDNRQQRPAPLGYRRPGPYLYRFTTGANQPSLAKCYGDTGESAGRAVGGGAAMVVGDHKDDAARWRG